MTPVPGINYLRKCPQSIAYSKSQKSPKILSNVEYVKNGLRHVGAQCIAKLWPPNIWGLECLQKQSPKFSTGPYYLSTLIVLIERTTFLHMATQHTAASENDK